MIDEVIEQTLAKMTPDVDTAGVVESVRHRTQRRLVRRRRRRLSAAGVAIVALCAVGVVIVRRDGQHRVATIDRAGEPAVAVDSKYFVPDWLPSGFELRSRSTSMRCDGQVATTSPSPCSLVFNMSSYGQPNTTQPAVTMAVLHPSAPVMTNAPVEVTVRGKPAAIDHFDTTQGPLEQWTVAWAENDTTVIALDSVGLTQADVLRVAQNLRQISESEWNASQATLQRFTPDPSTGVERARLTTESGEVVRLVEAVDRSWRCILRQDNSTCAGNPGSPIVPIDERPDHPTIMQSGATTNFAAFVISLPRDFPGEFSVRDSTGRTVMSATSNDRRNVLVVDTNNGSVATRARFNFVSPSGEVIATTI